MQWQFFNYVLPLIYDVWHVTDKSQLTYNSDSISQIHCIFAQKNEQVNCSTILPNYVLEGQNKKKDLSWVTQLKWGYYLGKRYFSSLARSSFLVK